MNRSTKRTATIAGVGLAATVGAVALALGGPGLALADPTPSPSGSTSTTDPGADRDARHAQRQDELAGALAKELGIDKAKVVAALEKVHSDRRATNKAEHLADLKTRLDRAVADGKLTREQADAILKAAETGVWPDRGPWPGWHGRPHR